MSKCNALFQDMQELECRIAYDTYLADPRLPLNKEMSFDDFAADYADKKQRERNCYESNASI